MKNLKTSLSAVLAAFLISGMVSANACLAEKKVNVEAYAHPSMFGAQTFEYSTDDNAYIKGGHILKPGDAKTVNGKKNVAVQTWANGVLDIIKNNSGNADLFNAKMPTLRSEWAVVLAEGFNVAKNNNCTNKYKDVSGNYWATGWICGALDTGMMIGYPSDVFKPDQPITKAEVFATIAQIVNVVPGADDKALLFKGQKMEYIPQWAENATAEVIATKLLDNLPDANKIAKSEYLTKEQVAYLVATLKADLSYYQKLSIDKNAPSAVTSYSPVSISIKLVDRISAKTSNIGDYFVAKTTKDVTIDGVNFPAGSTVNGRVVAVQRPGVKNPGYIKVKFVDICSGETKLDFPKNISEATSINYKRPFVLARILGAPFSMASRIVGVTGRTGASLVDVSANRLEEMGDNLSDVFVETFSGHPGSGAKAFGYAVWSVGKGIYDLGKTAVSGVFGVVYEFADECVYVILPSTSKESALNPNEELVILF